jgi:hypothetical protein
MAALLVAAAQHALAVEASVQAWVYPFGHRADISLTLTNKSDRDLCFYQSMHAPRLFDKNGKELPVEVTGVEIPIWVPPNEVQVVRHDGEEKTFQFSIGPSGPYSTPYDLSQVAKVSIDADLFDCIAFFNLPPQYPLNRKLRITPVHAEASPDFP